VPSLRIQDPIEHRMGARTVGCATVDAKKETADRCVERSAVGMDSSGDIVALLVLAVASGSRAAPSGSLRRAEGAGEFEHHAAFFG